MYTAPALLQVSSVGTEPEDVTMLVEHESSVAAPTASVSPFTAIAPFIQPNLSPPDGLGACQHGVTAGWEHVLRGTGSKNARARLDVGLVCPGGSRAGVDEHGASEPPGEVTALPKQ